MQCAHNFIDSTVYNILLFNAFVEKLITDGINECYMLLQIIVYKFNIISIKISGIVSFEYSILLALKYKSELFGIA